jgi:hypothetical protein
MWYFFKVFMKCPVLNVWVVCRVHFRRSHECRVAYYLVGEFEISVTVVVLNILWRISPLLGNGAVNTFPRLLCQQQKKAWNPEHPKKNRRPLLDNGFGYHGSTHVSDTTHIWTTVVETLDAVISTQFSRSYKRRPDQTKGAINQS